MIYQWGTLNFHVWLPEGKRFIQFVLPMACNSSTIYGTIWFTKNRRKKHDMARRNAERNTIIMLHEWMQKSAGFGARRNAGKKPLCVTRRQTKKSTIWPRRNKETMRCVLRKCKKNIFFWRKKMCYIWYIAKGIRGQHLNVFSRTRSKGSRFTLGVWGWGCVRSTRVYLCNRPRPSATVRNHPQPFATVRVRAVWPCLW